MAFNFEKRVRNEDAELPDLQAILRVGIKFLEVQKEMRQLGVEFSDWSQPHDLAVDGEVEVKFVRSHNISETLVDKTWVRTQKQPVFDKVWLQLSDLEDDE